MNYPSNKFGHSTDRYGRAHLLAPYDWATDEHPSPACMIPRRGSRIRASLFIHQLASHLTRPEEMPYMQSPNGGRPGDISPADAMLPAAASPNNGSTTPSGHQQRDSASNHGVHEPRRRRVQVTAPRSPANLRLRRARTSTRSDPSPRGRATSARRPAAGTLGLSSSRARRDGHTSSEMAGRAGLAFGARAFAVAPALLALSTTTATITASTNTGTPIHHTNSPACCAQQSSRVYTVAVEQQQPAKGTAGGQHQESAGAKPDERVAGVGWPKRWSRPHN